jgi:hypothetical protein
MKPDSSSPRGGSVRALAPGLLVGIGRTPLALLLTLWCVGALSPTRLLACRYIVREVGFVEVAPAPYRLVVCVGPETPPAWTDRLRNTATATFLDANVQLQLLDTSTALPAEAASLRTRHRLEQLPAAVLLGADDRSLPLPLPAPSGNAGDTTWALLEGVVSSPTRDALLKSVRESFAVVLLAEGDDPERNRRAHSAAEEAVHQLAKVKDQFPKLIKRPPQVLTVPAASAERERVLLWSLGLDHRDHSEPGAAVVYGRLRRVGQPLQGPELTPTDLFQRLRVLALDCECDLDRAWMQGPLIPVRWSAEVQAAVAQELGFDPEHPMVKAEISGILARGPSSTGRASSALEDPDGGVLGYREVSLDQAGATPLPTGPENGAVLEPGEAASAGPAAVQTNAVSPSLMVATRTFRVPFSLLALAALVIVSAGVWLLIFKRPD